MSPVWKELVGDAEVAVYQVRLLEDNFSYLIVANNIGIAVDPSEGKPLLSLVKELGCELEAVLVTHHHRDHVGGAEYLHKECGAQVMGPKHKELPFIDQEVEDGDECSSGMLRFSVTSTPGHVDEHLIYFFPDCQLLFTGDTLFLGGCGKNFEGTIDAYFESLQKLKAFPLKTEIFCGHDYLKRNLTFAKAIDPDNSLIDLDNNVASHTLEYELKINPFLKAETPEQFAALRQALDVFPN